METSDKLVLVTGGSGFVGLQCILQLLQQGYTDFAAIFGATPHHWLVEKRLKEARFLIEKKQQKPTEIYLDLGFEDLSHFSFAFKKHFGLNPSEVA